MNIINKTKEYRKAYKKGLKKLKNRKGLWESLTLEQQKFLINWKGPINIGKI